MAISFSNTASSLNRQGQSVLDQSKASATPNTSTSNTSIGNLTSPFGQPSGDLFSPLLSDHASPQLGNQYDDTLSQLPSTFTSFGNTPQTPRSSAMPNLGQSPGDRQQPTAANPYTDLINQAPTTFSAMDGGPAAPRGSSIPNMGQAPGGRAQPTVSTDRYAPLLDQLPTTNPFTGQPVGGGFTDMYGNPVSGRGELPNNGMVPAGRANPADAVTPGLTGTSPVITSTGSTYRQAGSPLMGSISYSSMPGEMTQSDLYSPLTGQMIQPTEPFTSPQTGQPQAPRSGLPTAPSGRLNGLPSMPRPGGF